MPPSRKRPFRKRLESELQGFLIDLVQLCGFLIILGVSQKLVERAFGDYLIFGQFPKKWLFDAGDIGLIGVFFVRAAMRFFIDR